MGVRKYLTKSKLRYWRKNSASVPKFFKDGKEIDINEIKTKITNGD